MIVPHLSPSFAEACPTFRGMALLATVVNAPTSGDLAQRIMSECDRVQQNLTLEMLKDLSPIAATRAAYKACGKDPARYRVASEQLLRRVLQGKGLYQVNTLVDVLNVASLASGYAIGGFDASMLVGDDILLDIGREGEPYEGIGRGALNVAGMPLYRDAMAGFATPTSDSERTKITLSTTKLLVFINAYDGDLKRLNACAAMIEQLLQEYAACVEPIEHAVFGVNP